MDIINGKLLGRSRELLLSSILVAVGKSGGGRRPIAMGEGKNENISNEAPDLNLAGVLGITQVLDTPAR